jgi:hypothetical protein
MKEDETHGAYGTHVENEKCMYYFDRKTSKEEAISDT